MARYGTFIHERKSWPRFYWDYEQFSAVLGEVRNLQGKLSGHMQALGINLSSEAMLETLSQDVLKSSEIEGEFLDPAQVRSSVARHLGMNMAGLVSSDRNVDGVVEMMLDATQHYLKPLTKKRIFAWQTSLFPGGRSGMHKILTGKWRDDKDGPMLVLSGAMAKERVHFQAPDAKVLNKEMEQFLKWFNGEKKLDPVLKAAVAHLWFVTLHPFDDGNGRIARALADLQLCKADGHAQRFYSMSAQIRKERKAYYEILEKTQRGDLDITNWLVWFLNCLHKALSGSDDILTNVMNKASYWKKHHDTELNARQKQMLNKLFDGLDGKLSTSRWAMMMKCSADTALRDIQDLVEKRVLEKDKKGGRSTNYTLV